MLVNANANWQVVSDRDLRDFRFMTLPMLLHLFAFFSSSRPIALLAKIVDDILMCGVIEHVDVISGKIRQHFTSGIVCHGPGIRRYFGFKIVQHEGYIVFMDGNDKLNAITARPLTCICRRDISVPIDHIKRKTFASINRGLAWLGIAGFVFRAQFTSKFQ